jgi:hypothetical protein
MQNAWELNDDEDKGVVWEMKEARVGTLETVGVSTGESSGSRQKHPVRGQT